MAANTRYEMSRSPEELVEAVDRTLQALAIEGQLRELVENNLERIREELAHDRKVAA